MAPTRIRTRQGDSLRRGLGGRVVGSSGDLVSFMSTMQVELVIWHVQVCHRETRTRNLETTGVPIDEVRLTFGQLFDTAFERGEDIGGSRCLRRCGFDQHVSEPNDIAL